LKHEVDRAKSQRGQEQLKSASVGLALLCVLFARCSVEKAGELGAPCETVADCGKTLVCSQGTCSESGARARQGGAGASDASPYRRVDRNSEPPLPGSTEATPGGPSGNGSNGNARLGLPCAERGAVAEVADGGKLRCVRVSAPPALEAMQIWTVRCLDVVSCPSETRCLDARGFGSEGDLVCIPAAKAPAMLPDLHPCRRTESDCASGCCCAYGGVCASGACERVPSVNIQYCSLSTQHSCNPLSASSSESTNTGASAGTGSSAGTSNSTSPAECCVDLARSPAEQPRYQRAPLAACTFPAAAVGAPCSQMSDCGIAQGSRCLATYVGSRARSFCTRRCQVAPVPAPEPSPAATPLRASCAEGYCCKDIFQTGAPLCVPKELCNGS